MQIKTTYDPKPIPDRSHDWSAVDEDTFDGAPDASPRSQSVGYGATEAEAIEDLKSQMDD